MREYEFKGKSIIKIGNIKIGDWVYGGISINYDRVWIDTPYYGQVAVEPETIGQYTGLKDKNGKKIFEGDIVKALYFETEVIGKIEFIYGTFALTNSAISDNQLFIFEKLEVIGNIWDNPDLLKEEL